LKKPFAPTYAILARTGALKRLNLIILQISKYINFLQYIDIRSIYWKEHNKHKLQCLSSADSGCLSDKPIWITDHWWAHL